MDKYYNVDKKTRRADIYVTKQLHGTTAATGANYGIIFVAPEPCRVTKISEVHTTKGTDSSAVSLDVERLQGTEAPGNGDVLLNTTKINLKGAVNTVQSPTLTGTSTNLNLSTGDRLCLKDAGTLTNVAGVCVTVHLNRRIVM